MKKDIPVEPVLIIDEKTNTAVCGRCKKTTHMEDMRTLFTKMHNRRFGWMHLANYFNSKDKKRRYEATLCKNCMEELGY